MVKVSRLVSVIGLAIWATLIVVPYDVHAQPSTSMNAVALQVSQDFVSRAAFAERQQQWLAAEGLYRQAFDADPTYFPARYGYARLLAQRGHVSDARSVLNGITNVIVLNDENLVLLARLYISMGDVNVATNLLNGRTESAVVVRAIAQIAAEQGRFPEALAAARRYLELTRLRYTNEEEQARVMVRAFVMLCGETDAITTPGPSPNWVRRHLADSYSGR